MDLDISMLACSILCLCAWVLMPYLRSRSRMAPGPWSLPIVGNLLQLGSHARSHIALAKLATKYGPVMTLRLGCMKTVVLSSADAARQMFKDNDLALAGRTLYECMRLNITQLNDQGVRISAREGSIITAQYGPQWRLLRRLSSHDFFSNKRLDATKSIRSECLDSMVRFIREESEDGKRALDVGKFVYITNFNVLGNLVFSKNLVNPNCKEGNEFFEIAGKIMELLGKPNLADFIPILKRLDPHDIKRKSQYYMEKIFEIMTQFTAERIQACRNKAEEEKEDKDYLDVLLDFRGQRDDEPAYLLPVVINGSALEMFIAGTDTTTRAVEWALAELLHSPATMTKLRSELFDVVGPHGKLEEEDIGNLPYLRAVVKEALRMHPPVPLLVPHRAMESCTLMGYSIPEDTQILVNVWAIGRDPKIWDEPDSFKPERFLDANIDYKGHHFEFLPFGAGRRICAGMPLAHRMTPLILGTLLLSFDWVLPDGLKPETLNMREKLGINLKREKVLEAIPLPRMSQT